MSLLIYTTNVSLDGYIEDQAGKFDWTDPSDELFSFITNLIRADGTHLYGRRMYESMQVWETDLSLAEASTLTRDFAGVWQAADKVVYSHTLQAVQTKKTRIERSFDTEAVRQLKRTTRQQIHIGGAELAAAAFRAGLVDEINLFIHPVVVGGGKKALPDDVRLELGLLDQRSFTNGVVYLRYQVK